MRVLYFVSLVSLSECIPLAFHLSNVGEPSKSCGRSDDDPLALIPLGNVVNVYPSSSDDGSTAGSANLRK
jgi:hypothetical protein